MNNSFRIRTDNKKTEAFIAINPQADFSKISEESLKEFLKEFGIVTGIEDSALREVLDSKRIGEEILIAKGSLPIKGEDGKIKYHFDPDPKITPKVNHDGTVDYHQLNLQQGVLKGQILAELIPPKEGIPGIDVFGKVIVPARGANSKLLKGTNTEYADDTRTALVSAADGNVKIRQNGTIEVETSTKIHKDIDFGTGNIESKGDMVIDGSVRAGFKLKADGNIEIFGEVEDAEIEAGGTVVVRGGFVGDGKGRIQAGENIIVKFVHRQTLVAGKDIRVMEEAVQPTIRADGSVYIVDGKGVLISGTICAGKNIEINIIGNEHYPKTEIRAGERPGILGKIEELKKNLTELDERMDKIAKKMNQLMELKAKVGITSKMEEQFRALDKLSADVQLEIEGYSKELIPLEKMFEESRHKSYIKVNRQIYPTATMWIGGMARVFEEERPGCTLKISNNNIVII